MTIKCPKCGSEDKRFIAFSLVALDGGVVFHQYRCNKCGTDYEVNEPRKFTVEVPK